MEWLCREPRKIVIRLFNGTFSATGITNVWFMGGVAQGQSVQKELRSSVTMTVFGLISVLHISAKENKGASPCDVIMMSTRSMWIPLVGRAPSQSGSPNSVILSSV